MPATFPLDARVTALIDSIRSAIRRYIVWDGLLAVSLLILSAFWIGLALDWLPVKLGGTEMPRSARAILLTLVAIGTAFVVYRLLLSRLWRPLPDDSLALLVERHHPRLGGRLVTAIQLAGAGREGDSHDPSLLKHVHDEVAADLSDIDTHRIFQWNGIIRKAMMVGPMLLAAIVLLIASPQTFARATSRLTLLSDTPWPRKATLEMVGVELPRTTSNETETDQTDLVEFNAEAKTMQLPRGSNGTLRIRAKADEGAVVPTVCTAYYETDGGVRGQANLKRVGREVDGYQAFVLDGPPLAGLSESMSISVRGLDDRLDDFRIESVEPPAITSFEVAVRDPDYLREGLSTEIDVNDSVTEYQAGLRIREGSRVTLTAKSNRPLGSADAIVEQNGVALADVKPVLVDGGNAIRFNLPDFESAATIRIVPIDRNGISAQAPYRYFINVIRDQPPEVKLKLSGIGSAVTPVARLPLSVTATDDYGIDDISVQVATTAGAEAEQPEGQVGDADLPTDLIALRPDLNRDGIATGAIDLRDIVDQKQLKAIQPGGVVNVFAETSDAFDLVGRHVVRSELYRLQVVTSEQLLALLERRELGLRSRLEQTIDETRNLRDALSRLNVDVAALDEESADNAKTDVDAEVAGDSLQRDLQILRLRAQQSGLQAAKTGEELAGIVASLDDLLQEMINNRVDSVDRRERIGAKVREPLHDVVATQIPNVRSSIRDLEMAIGDPDSAGEQQKRAVDATDDVLLRLTSVLENMLDLESYNEILDLVRGLIDDQEAVKKETDEQRKKRIKNFFDDL